MMSEEKPTDEEAAAAPPAEDAAAAPPEAADEEVGVEQAKEPAAKESITVAGVEMDNTQLSLFIVLISSVVLLIATGCELPML